MTEGNPKVMVVYDQDSHIERAAGDLSAIADLLLLTGNMGKKSRGLILLQKHSNSMGLFDNGAEPGFLPGRLSLENGRCQEKIRRGMESKTP